jgi:hypothetical protein
MIVQGEGETLAYYMGIIDFLQVRDTFVPLVQRTLPNV